MESRPSPGSSPTARGPGPGNVTAARGQDGTVHGMNDVDQAPGRQRTPWLPREPLPQQEAEEFARTALIIRDVLRAYATAHIVPEETAEAEIRQLVGRFLQVGRVARNDDGIVRARSPKSDAPDDVLAEAYSFLVDLRSGVVFSYRGPARSWFDDVHVPTEDLRREQAEQRRILDEKTRRREEHEQREREQREAAAARRPPTLPVTWPLLPAGYYDRDGNPSPAPARRPPITDEARIRHVGRLPHVVFHSDALNSPYFRNVPLEGRGEAMHRVLDTLLRAPSKGTVTITADTITVTGNRVTMTLSPAAAAVLTLNPPRPSHADPPAYSRGKWPRR